MGSAALSVFFDAIYSWSMIFSENRYPLFGIMLYSWSMIFSENRCPLFGIML